MRSFKEILLVTILNFPLLGNVTINYFVMIDARIFVWCYVRLF